MKYAVCAFLFLALISCSTPGEKDRINYELVNESGEKLAFSVGIGWISKGVEVDVDAQTTGWVDPSFAKGKTVRIVVRKRK